MFSDHELVYFAFCECNLLSVQIGAKVKTPAQSRSITQHRNEDAKGQRSGQVKGQIPAEFRRTLLRFFFYSLACSM